MQDTIQKAISKYGSPLNLLSVSLFRQAYQNLQVCLPSVKHHYAMKPLPLKECIQAISECSGYLDLCSTGEMRLVHKHAPHMLERSIFTHPIKKKQEIEESLRFGVNVMIAENEAELHKLLPYKTQVRLLIRIGFPNEEALVNLSAKFGVPHPYAVRFIGLAYHMGFQVIGCSFHVGSAMPSPNMHVQAIEQCREIYDQVQAEFGLRLEVLNIGGGFPAQLNGDTQMMREFCTPIHLAIEKHFSDHEVWSEPGRSVATGCLTNVTQVVGKKMKDGKPYYYLDDGVYGTYSNVVYDPGQAIILEPLSPMNGPKLPSVFAGPTCDCIDVIHDNYGSEALYAGDYVFSRNMGAYTLITRSNFNFLPPARLICAETLDELQSVYDMMSLGVEQDIR